MYDAGSRPSPTDGQAASQAAAAGSDAGSLAGLTSDMQQIKQMADNGEFAVDPEALKVLIKPIQEYIDFWDGGYRFKLNTVGQQMRAGLGPDPYATQIAGYHEGRANDASAKLEQLRDALHAAKEALTRASKNYANMEDEAAQSFHTDNYL